MNRKAIFGAVLIILTLYRSAHGQLIFPHYAQGGGYQTTFTLTNLSQTPATASVQTFFQNGAPATNLTISLAPNGSGAAALSGANLTVGWARVMLSPPVSATGFETIQLINDAGVIADASVLPTVPTVSSQFAVVQRNGVATGLAFANPGSTSTTVNLALRDQSGAVIGTQTVSVGPSQQVARFITEFFHGIGAFDGSIQIFSSPPIAVIGLKELPSGIFSTLPSGPSAANSAVSSIESFFSPAGGIALRITQEIERAVSSIDIAIYTFTETEIADELIAAKNRGVSIRIVADAGEASATGSVIARLERAGFQVKRTEGIGTGIMHNKYVILDGRLLITGSYNWSDAAEIKNFENVVFIQDSATVSSYQNNFISIWNTR